MDRPDAEDLVRSAGTHIDRVAGCQKAGVRRRRTTAELPQFAIALSGGGFRATLAAVGVLRFFASANLLSHVSVISSVSGGSVASGQFAAGYDQIAGKGFSLQAFDEGVTSPLLRLVSSKSMTMKLVSNSWKALRPGVSRTDVLADVLDDCFYKGQKLCQITDKCDFVINATNLNSGSRFGFQQYRIGDYTLGFAKPLESLRLAQAVAASAAVPGVFAAMDLDQHSFPCDMGYSPTLVDGGVYDNLGVEPIKFEKRACLVVANSGGTFRVGKLKRVPIAGLLSRSNSVMYRQSSALRMRDLVERFKQWERANYAAVEIVAPTSALRGVVFGLGTTMDTVSPAWLAGRPRDSDPNHLEALPTSFSKFSVDSSIRLIQRGWWLTGASLATFHPDLVTNLPSVVPIR